MNQSNNSWIEFPNHIDSSVDNIDYRSNYEYNMTKMWLENVFNQIALSSIEENKQKMRPILIEIDLNILNEKISLNSTQFLIELIKSEIETSFEIFSSSLQLIFISLYTLMIVSGLVSNSFVVYAFYRSKNLRTFRNIFIVNLAIRFN